MKSIFGFCPCCGELFRLSDATLFTKWVPPKTPFDRLDEAWERLDRAEEDFDFAEEAVRQKAVERGRREAGRKLKTIASVFVERRIHPQDVKVLFDPVTYVAFKGLTTGSMRSVELVDIAPRTAAGERTLTSIEKAITRGNLEWITLRIAGDGTISSE